MVLALIGDIINTSIPSGGLPNDRTESRIDKKPKGIKKKKLNDNQIQLLIDLIENGNPRFKAIYLPPYSPFLNATEEVFAKMKSLVRSDRVFIQSTLLESVARAIAAITIEDCAGYVRHTRTTGDLDDDDGEEMSYSELF